MQLKLVGILGAFCAAIGAPSVALAQTAEQEAAADIEAADAEAVARLIEVWGFVKYHHSDALEGRIAMDLEFFDLYPKVRRANSLGDVDAMLAGWLEGLGTGDPCDPCAETPDPSVIAIPTSTPQWLAALPANLSAPLRAIYDNRSGAQANFQISTARNIGNPVFHNEGDYSNTGRVEDEALHLLTLARQWNALRYWFPYRDVMDEAPDAILASAVADFLAVGTLEEKHKARMRFAARSDDGHAIITAYDMPMSSPGECASPYGWQFVEGQLALDGRAAPGNETLRRGDIVTAIDGQPIADLSSGFAPYIATSNPGWMDLVLAVKLSGGECGERQLGVERNGQSMQVTVDWLPKDETGFEPWPRFVSEGEAVEQREDGITYVRFQDLTRNDLPKLIETANAGKGVVLDMRGYVRDFLVFELGQLLVDEPTDFVNFTSADVSTPGRFLWGTSLSIAPDPQGRRITVPVVALVNASAGSSAEYHAMAYRAAGVTMIGSSTAGADGNVSTLPLPDGAGMRYSGIGVYYPDRSPTQRVGIVPDIAVEPTIEGMAAGRDEVLERALQELSSR